MHCDSKGSIIRKICSPKAKVFISSAPKEMIVTLKWAILWIIWSLTSKAFLDIHFDFRVINSQHSVFRYEVKSGNGYLKEKKRWSIWSSSEYGLLWGVWNFLPVLCNGNNGRQLKKLEEYLSSLGYGSSVC